MKGKKGEPDFWCSQEQVRSGIWGGEAGKQLVLSHTPITARPLPTTASYNLQDTVMFTLELTVPISQMKVKTQGSHLSRAAG